MPTSSGRPQRSDPVYHSLAGKTTAKPLVNLVHATPQQRQALETLEGEFNVSEERLREVMERFVDEMRRGLEGEPTNLLMQPAFLTGFPNGEERGTFFALEICDQDVYYQYAIPDELRIMPEVFDLLDYVADCVSDFLIRVGIHDLFVYPIAMSFGHPMHQTQLDSGVVLRWSHGFSYPSSRGSDIVQLMDHAFSKKGLPLKLVAVANDTTCTLLAHAYQHSNALVGMVLGVGTNCVYHEALHNIKKLPNFPTADPSMIVNTEWGGFDNSREILPLTWFDRQLDRSSLDPKQQIYEKMVAGFYLGELVRLIIAYLIDTDVLFNGSSTPQLNTQNSFDTTYMYACETDDSPDYKDVRWVLEDMLGLEDTTLGDREVVKRVVELVGTRSAQLIAANLAAIVGKIETDGTGIGEDGCSIAVQLQESVISWTLLRMGKKQKKPDGPSKEKADVFSRLNYLYQAGTLLSTTIATNKDEHGEKASATADLAGRVAPERYWVPWTLLYSDYERDRCEVNDTHIKQLKVRPKKVAQAAPCVVEMGALMECWAKSSVDSPTCAQAAKALATCMNKPARKVQHTNTINYHLARLGKHL
ncbi:hypothetical protein BZG36_05090 [Bifiguratus adelaidae]|uniref:Phosphotransferase n=1 Tax=Bifiguratus adelaidae TaxID=1938954 RepID=A0A261XWA8_9FUNG|nr:hypothetical protein BZG36_05090 [Bifiguratus adelaidae]